MNYPYPKSANWSPSVYFFEVDIALPLKQAWEKLIDYQSWNPTFAGARVTPLAGSPRTEGEVVLINKNVPYDDGKPRPEFLAITAKVVPYSHIVWYIYPTQGHNFLNFVDLQLTETPTGVKYNVNYYAQTIAADENELAAERAKTNKALGDLALAFKRHCKGG